MFHRTQGTKGAARAMPLMKVVIDSIGQSANIIKPVLRRQPILKLFLLFQNFLLLSKILIFFLRFCIDSSSGCFWAWKSFLATITPSLKRYSQIATRWAFGINILHKQQKKKQQLDSVHCQDISTDHPCGIQFTHCLLSLKDSLLCPHKKKMYTCIREQHWAHIFPVRPLENGGFRRQLPGLICKHKVTRTRTYRNTPAASKKENWRYLIGSFA